MQVTGGSTDVTTYFALRLAADGTAATGLTITNFDLQYVRSGAAPSAKVDATALAATNSAHADNKAIEIDATDQPGLYRVDWPDAAFAAAVREVVLTVKVATAFTEHLAVEIDPLGAPAGASISADVAAVKAETALIVADTNELQTDDVPGLIATLDAVVDTVKAETALIVADTNELQTDDYPTSIAAVKAETALIVADTNELQTDDYPTSIAAVKAETALIVADTNELQTDDYPTSIAAIKAETVLIVEDTGTTLPATLATAQADLDTITGTAGVELGTAQTAAWASQLEASAGQIIEATVDTVVNTHTPTTTVFQADDITEATADHYNGRIVIFTSGALIGQATDITDYAAVGGIGQFTVTAMTEAPANNDTFVIV